MMKRMMIMLIVVTLVFAGVFGYLAFGHMMMGKMMAKYANPPQTISTVVASLQPWRTRIDAVGSLQGIRGADIAAEVSGIVDTIHFTSGEDVPAGRILATLRDADDLGKLHALQAAAGLARTVLKRDQEQIKVQAISQAGIDTDAANLANAQALVEQQQAVVDKKTIVAPFAGRLGIRAVSAGQYLSAGTMIVTLQALDPIYVDFAIPQQSLPLFTVGMPVSVSVANGAHPILGTISSIDAKVDVTTRNIMVRARIPNPSHGLVPGMFVQVSVETGKPVETITLPQTAVVFSTFGESVYEVVKGPDQPAQAGVGPGGPTYTAKQVIVSVGATRGDQIQILKGLKPGATVVSAGQVKLHNGSAILINNAILPLDEANPAPSEQ